MQYLPASLRDFLYEVKRPWPVGLLRRLFGCIVLGLEACHSAGVAHMDIKIENVNLTRKLVPVICDFGMSRQYHDQESNFGCTLKFAAPEAVDFYHGHMGPLHDWRRSDLWALGVMLY
jgi:serine/threonine protein kinase